MKPLAPPRDFTAGGKKLTKSSRDGKNHHPKVFLHFRVMEIFLVSFCLQAGVCVPSSKGERVCGSITPKKQLCDDRICLKEEQARPLGPHRGD